MFLYKSYIFYMDLISKWTKYNIGRILWKNEQKCFSSENTNLIETQTIHKWSFGTRWVVQTQVSGTDSGEWYRLMWVVQTQMSGTDSGEHLVCIITNSYERWDNKYDCIDRCCIYQTNTKPTCQYIFFWIIVEKYLVQ